MCTEVIGIIKTATPNERNKLQIDIATQKVNSGGYVTQQNDNGKYCARIFGFRKVRHIGSFSNKQVATLAYAIAKMKLERRKQEQKRKTAEAKAAKKVEHKRNCKAKKEEARRLKAEKQEQKRPSKLFLLPPIPTSSILEFQGWVKTQKIGWRSRYMSVLRVTQEVTLVRGQKNINYFHNHFSEPFTVKGKEERNNNTVTVIPKSHP